MQNEQIDFAAMNSEIEYLHSLLQNRRKVDLCDFGELKFFFYTDDYSYQTVPESRRHCQLTRQDISRVRNRSYAPITIDDLYSGKNLVGKLMAHFWNNNLDFTYVDIGCPYGFTAISAAHIIEASGRDNRVVCFDPGIGSGLVAQNIALNGFQERVTFEHSAVSNHCLPLILSSSLSHAEGNHVVNRNVDLEDMSFIVENTSLDTYLGKRGITENLILKVDTEGAEYEILKGMQETLSNRHVASIWEFQPSFLSTRIDPSLFLEYVSKDAYLFDIGQDHIEETSVKQIRRVDIDSFVQEVLSKSNPWTDILVLPRELPGVNVFLKDLGVELNQLDEERTIKQNLWFGSGWYAKEDYGRWIARSSEMFVKTDGHKQLVLDCLISPEILRDVYGGTISIQLFQDDKPAKPIVLVYKPGFEGPFSVFLELENRRQITLYAELDKTFSPKKIGTGEDSRELGIIVRNVELV